CTTVELFTSLPDANVLPAKQKVGRRNKTNIEKVFTEIIEYLKAFLYYQMIFISNILSSIFF
ncbi:MAG: hypothetical protein V3V72_11585, partial [Ignavibacteriaceae bacterium]